MTDLTQKYRVVTDLTQHAYREISLISHKRQKAVTNLMQKCMYRTVTDLKLHSSSETVPSITMNSNTKYPNNAYLLH